MTRFRNMIWLLIIPLLAFGIHKHYISLTKIEFIKEEKAVQITMKFFLDDIELALENRTGESMELASKYENKLADKYLETYIRQKFKIWIDEKEMTYNFLGKEYDNNEVFFYIELQNIDKINTIEVENSMLFETIEETQKTFILVKSNVKEMLKL